MYVTSTTTNANGNTNGHAARSLHGHGHSGSVTSQGGGGGGRYYGGEYGGNGNERGGVYNNSNHHQQAPQHQQQQQHGYGNHPYQHHHQQQQHQPSEDNNGTTTTYSPYDQQQQQRSSYERDSVYGDRDGDGDGGLSEDDGAPVRPSAKALGKRKVVDDGEADGEFHLSSISVFFGWLALKNGRPLLFPSKFSFLGGICVSSSACLSVQALDGLIIFVNQSSPSSQIPSSTNTHYKQNQHPTSKTNTSTRTAK